MAEDTETTVRRKRAGDDGTMTNVDPLRPSDRVGPSTTEVRFPAGTMLAERYRVERFLARGGMGEVYQVFDQELGESVALKTILEKTEGDRTSLDRFRREIQIARKISHPNVCRIFDLGKHQDAAGNEVLFLTMELLRGVSLRARLHDGPMKPDEAVEVVGQMAAGLGAAHRLGIVHRDLKPSNIFLVPDGDTTRVVIADFGLARSQLHDVSHPTVTGTGEILGTPAYMSPEQIEGRPATTASDVYALGLIMYEMLTGVRAFEGDSAFQMALAKLRDAPTSPSKRSPGIPPRWDRTILRCLEKDPADRPSDVAQIPAILTGSRRLPRSRWRKLAQRPLVWAFAAVVAAGVGLTLAKLGLWPFGPAAGNGAAVAIRPSVAVLGFHNATGDPERAWISTALADYLTTELAAGGALRAVPGESVARARSELDMTQPTTLGAETLARLRDLLTTDLVILGSFTVLGGEGDAVIRLDCRVQSTADGETTVLGPVTGPLDKLFDVASNAAVDIRARLGLDLQGGSVAAAALPSDPQAARFYAEGVARLRSFDPVGARVKLERAATAAPESALVWLQLANAWTELGFGANALAAAERSRALSADLDREMRLRIEGQCQLLAGRMDEAVQTFRSLWLVYPDNLEYGLGLAEAQVAAGMAESALETVDQLRSLPAPLSEDPRIDLAEADAAAQRGDAARQADAAARVVAASRRLGSTRLEAEGRLALGNALRESGDYDRALTELESVRRLEEAAGNRAGEAGAAYSLALVHLSMGDVEAGIGDAEASLQAAREVGARISEANALNLLGSIRIHQGDFGAALEVFETALDLYRDTGNRSGEADALNNVALVQMWSGDFVAAVDSFTLARARYRSLGKEASEAAVVMNLARVDAARGDLDGARSLFEEAAGLYREQQSPEPLADALFGLGEVLLTQGDLVGARARHEEALALRRDLGLPSVAESEFALAGIALASAELGQASYEEAAAALSRAVTELAEQERPALVADALNYLAEAELGSGRLDRAETTLDRIRDLAASANSVTRMVLRINEARLAARRGRPDEGEDILAEVLGEARASASLGVELEARLVMAEILADSGRVEDARRQLRDLRQQATARGWILLAERAAVAERRADRSRD